MGEFLTIPTPASLRYAEVGDIVRRIEDGAVLQVFAIDAETVTLHHIGTEFRGVSGVEQPVGPREGNCPHPQSAPLAGDEPQDPTVPLSADHS